VINSVTTWLTVQCQTNFATEFLADEAIARAKELDAIFKETGKTVGPLHGIPISVKEHVALKGKRCNAGFVAWVNDELAEEDSLTVAYLKNAGAVVHVRTNQPQSLMVSGSAKS
jgi:amidase